MVFVTLELIHLVCSIVEAGVEARAHRHAVAGCTLRAEDKACRQAGILSSLIVGTWKSETAEVEEDVRALGVRCQHHGR